MVSINPDRFEQYRKGLSTIFTENGISGIKIDEFDREDLKDWVCVLLFCCQLIINLTGIYLLLLLNYEYLKYNLTIKIYAGYNKFR